MSLDDLIKIVLQQPIYGFFALLIIAGIIGSFYAELYETKRIAFFHDAVRAIEYGNIDDLKALLAQHPECINASDRRKYWRLIHYAAAEGYIDMVDYLISQGAEVNASSPHGTPLTCALKGNHMDVADLLRSCGAKE
ncbi:MAG: ankyrin repeat domain-containing protein [Candidatus Eremiobacteraeota bacterium]|nr:ankyrin repeat domain-containing protein [Candidatus Eremiobacteraeota bacterium]